MNIEELRKKNKPSKNNNTGKKKNELLALLQKDITLFNNFGLKEKERFFSEMGTLLGAGVDLHTVIELCEEGAKKSKKLHEVYQQLLKAVKTGSSLADAMKTAKQFNNFDIYSVEIGENTGALKTVLKQLHQYYTRRIAQKRKITSAMSYPIIILCTTLAAVTFMLKFVVPMFAQTLTQFGGELPAITKFIIYVSDNMSRYFWVTVISISAIAFFLYKNKDNETQRKYTATILLHIPFWGGLVRKMHLSQMVESLSLLMSTKVNMYDSIALTEKMTRFYPIEQLLGKIKKGLVAGESLYNCIADETIIDHKAKTLIKIGEEVNQLDNIFTQLNQQYQSEIDYQSNLLITILEPLMILFLALIIGVILIAMYLPMFKIGTVVG